MKKNIYDEDIDILDITSKAKILLKINNICIISELCNNTKTDLKNIGLSTHDIHNIEIQLQLVNLDLLNSKSKRINK